MPKGVARVRGPAPGTQLRVQDVKVGIKVRIRDMKGRPSAKVFTIQAFDPDEPNPGPDWFAIDAEKCVHVSALVAA